MECHSLWSQYCDLPYVYAVLFTDEEQAINNQDISKEKSNWEPELSVLHTKLSKFYDFSVKNAIFFTVFEKLFQSVFICFLKWSIIQSEEAITLSYGRNRKSSARIRDETLKKIGLDKTKKNIPHSVLPGKLDSLTRTINRKRSKTVPQGPKRKELNHRVRYVY